MLHNGAGNAVAAGAVVAGWIGLCVVMLTARRPPAGEGAAKRDASSAFGIALQSLGIGAAWAAPIHIDADWPFAREVWIAGAPVAALAMLSLLLFIWSAATMGRNWSLIARTREDHKLVQDGPFAVVRHPIYVALFGLMVAAALALGHPVNLIVAIPLYLWGTLLRVAIEERLLRNAFGDAYDAYARRVKRFIPGVW